MGLNPSIFEKLQEKYTFVMISTVIFGFFLAKAYHVGTDQFKVLMEHLN